MSIDLIKFKSHLNFTEDNGAEDDAILGHYLAAAVALIAAQLGADNAAPSETVDQAVLLLAAHWYENREASLVGVTAQDLPLGVAEIIREFRNYTFGLC